MAAVAEKHGQRLKVHLALSAGGMSRNGLEMGTEQGRQEALAITRLAPLELVGIMTHFTVQDKDDVRQGLSAFNEQTAWLIMAAGIDRSDGQRAPVVGKVSMNTVMVDETDIPAMRAGDQVVLFGKQGDSEITQSELEELSGTLLVDLATVWGSSNPQTLVTDKTSD